MLQWPISGPSVLLRLSTRPNRALLIHITSRPWDRLQISSSPYPNSRVKPTEDTNGPGSSGPPSPDGAESNTTTFSAGSSQNQAMNLDAFKNRLKERASSISTSATLSLAEIGGRLNKVTGYEHIEALKRKVVETETAISTKRQASRNAKLEYETAVARRSNSQREVNDLLQRKSSWTDADVSRFTVLVREDHLYEQEEARAKTQVSLMEAEVEVVFNELMRTILNRYHEEQVWSDKIRSASTYGSLLALGVNIVVFFLAIVVVEPWKRRRLAQTFEKRIEELSLENRAVLRQGMSNFAEHFEKQEQVFARVMGTSSPEGRDEHGKTERTDVEGRPAPPLSVAKTAKSARDRDLLIAGAVGAVGGGVLTLLMGFFR